MEKLVILLVLVALANAGPLKTKTDQCAHTCTGSNKFNYEQGKTYTYVYDSNVKTLIDGATEDHAGLSLNALVHLEVLSKCELTMRLTDVQLSEYDPMSTTMKDISADFKQGLEKNAIRFDFQDGKVAELCLEEEEPTWVLNVKRGILSVFQNSMKDLTVNQTEPETDVSGVCDTEYIPVRRGWTSTSLVKRKNLLGCTDRHSFNTAVQSIPYTAQSEVQSMPIMNSTYECTHEVNTRSGLLTSAECRDMHTFRPFSQSGSGAITINTQNLRFKDTRSGTKSPVRPNIRKPMKFEHAHDPSKEANTKKEVTRKLTEICEKTKQGVQLQTPHLFTDLVFMMRASDVTTLTSLYKLVQDGTICPDNKDRTRKFFLDALPVCGTQASVSLMTDLLMKKEVTGVEADMWLTSLSFIKYPTQDMLKEVKVLINMKEMEDKALLSVGTLVHTYCYHHGNCENDRMVRAIVSAFENKIAKGCKVNQDNFHTILLALRGLGNIGYAESAIPTLEMCMKIESNPIEIRLSAIEAFRRMPCNAERRRLTVIFTKTDEDSEVRIAAYKALMVCPTKSVLNTVKLTLESEQINQVGSYVWSHLTNILETSDPHQQELKALLENMSLNKEFDLDKMKFSRNYEKSIFLNKINTGAKLEGDAIWSSKSFIPRSGMVNLTVDLFGHSVNLLEIGSRAEGLEYFLESFFGPNGYFGNKAAEAETTDLSLPSIKTEKIKKMDSRFGSNMADLRGSMYMRVFGNELSYMNFDSMESLLAGPGFNFLDMMIQLAKDNDYTYSYSTMFMDSSFIVPTGSGFPMNLTVNGTATIDLKLKGKIDLRRPPMVDIVGLVQPSAAIDISSVMSVDAFVTKSGIKMVSTLHSNTAVQGKVKVSETGVVSAEYEVPNPKMEIIEVKSSFFTLHRDMEKEQKMIEENRQRKTLCTPDQLITIVGLELCAELEYPNASLVSNAPYFPLTGPVQAGIYLYNRDTHTKYKMEAKSIHNDDKNILHFTFDTPDSYIDRHLMADVTLDKKAMTFDMTLVSPWKKASLSSKLSNDKALKSLTGKFNIDGKAPYSINAQMQFKRVGNAYKYMPSLEISLPNMAPVRIYSMVMYNGIRQIDMELETSGPYLKPLTAKVTMQNKPKMKGIMGSLELQKGKPYSFDINLIMQTDAKKAMYKQTVSVRSPAAEVLAFGGTVKCIYEKRIDYNFILDQVVSKKVTLKGSFVQILKKRSRALYRSKVDFSSGPADLIFNANIDNRNFRSITSSMDLKYVIRKYSRNNIKLVSKFVNLSSTALKKGRANIELNVKRNPEWNMKIDTNMEHNKKLSNLELDLKYGGDFKNDSKRLYSTFKMNRKIAGLTSAVIDFDSRILYPALGLNTMLKGQHMHNNKELDSSIELRFGKSQPIISGLRLLDETKEKMRVSGEYRLSFSDREIVLNHTLEEKKTGAYLSTLNAQLNKGKKSAIITLMEPVNDRRAMVKSDIHLHGLKPVHLEADVGMDPFDFITRLAYEKESRRYEGSVISKTRPNDATSRLEVAIIHPEREVMFEVSGVGNRDKFTLDSNLRWNAGRDDSKFIRLTGWMEQPTGGNLNGSVSVIYPGRTLILNAHHKSSPKYITHADFQWEKEQKISADTTFVKKGETIKASAAVTTPFTVLPRASIDIEHTDDDVEYLSNVVVNWNKGESITLDANLKKPYSLKTLVGSITTKTSLKKLKRARFEINHKLSGSLASSAKAILNNNFVQTDVTLQNVTKGRKIGYTGQMNIKTSFREIKRGLLKFSHDNNGKKFNTELSFLRNRKLYSLSNSMTNTLGQTLTENSGNLKLTSPSATLDNNWSLTLSSDSASSSFSSSWAKNKKVNMQLNINLKNALDATLELQTPFKKAEEVVLQVLHKISENELESRLRLQNKKDLITLAEVKAVANDNIAKAGLILQIPPLNIDSHITGNTSATNQDSVLASANLDVIITPEIAFNLDAKQHFMNGAAAHSIFVFTSAFPGYEFVRYSHEYMIGDYFTITRLDYGKDKVIEMKTKLALEPKDIKMKTYMLLTTPFETMQKMEVSVDHIGDLRSFNCYASAEIVPALKETSASLSWNQDNFVGNFKLIRLLGRDPHISVDVTGKFANNEISTDLDVEYMEGKVIKTGISLKGETKKYDGSLYFEYTAGKRYSVALSFTNGTETEGSLIFSSPGRRDIRAMFTHRGTLSDLATHIEITHNRKNQFQADTTFSLQDKLSLTSIASLKTDIIPMPDNDIKASISLSCSSEEIHTAAHLSTEKTGKSDIDIKLDSKKDIEGDFVLRSDILKNIKASFSHHSKEHFMLSKVGIIRGGVELINGLFSLDTDMKLDSELKIKNAWTEDIAMKTRLTGIWRNMVLHSEGSFGSYKADLEWNSNLENKLFRQELSIKATNVPDVFGEVSFTGDLNQFRTFAEIKIGQDKHFTEVSFNQIHDIELTSSISSPLIPEIQLSFTHSGQITDFNCHGELSIGKNRTEISLSFMTNPRIEGNIAFSSPFSEDVKASLEITGLTTDFTSRAQLSLDKKNQLDIKVEFTAKQVISGSLTAQSPYFSNIETSFSHDGSLRKFNSKARVTYGTHYTSGEVTFTSYSQYKGELSLKSDLFKDKSIKFEQTGDMNDFRLEGEAINGNENAKMNAQVDLVNGKNIALSMRSPYTGKMGISLSHDGTLNKFRSTATAFKGTLKWTGSINFDCSENIDAEISFIPPTDFSLKGMTLTFEQRGVLLNSRTKAEAMYGNDRVIGILNMAVSDASITSFLSFVSPFTEDITINFKHSGSIKDIKTHADISIGTEKSEGDLTIQIKEQSIHTSIDLKSPAINDIQGSFNFKGMLSDLTTKGSVVVGGRKSTGEATLSIRGNAVSSYMKIETPDMETITINFKHTGEIDNFETHGDITIGSTESVADLKLNANKKTVALTISSPELSLKLSHNGGIDNFESMLTVNERYMGTVKLMTRDKMEGSIRISSPINGYENINAMYSLTGQLNNFNGHTEITLDNKRSSADLKLNALNLLDMEATFDLSSPILPSINSKLTYVQRQKQLRGLAEINIDGRKTYGATFTFSKDSALKGDIEIMTPFTGFDNIKLQGSYSDSKNVLKSSAELTFGSERNEIELTLIKYPNIDGTFSLRTVYLPRINANINIDGELTAFTGKSSLSVDDDKVGDLEISINIKNKIDMSYSFASEMINTNVNSEFLLSKSNDNVQLKTLLTNKGEKMIDFNTKLEMKDTIKGSLYLNSVIPHPLLASIDVNGDLSNFQSTIELSHNGSRLLSGGLTFSFEPTPFAFDGSLSMNNIQMNLGILLNEEYKVHAELKHDSKAWSANTLVKSVIPMDASLTIQVPGRVPIYSSVSFTKPSKSMTAHAELDMGPSNKFEYDMVFHSLQNIDVSIKTPIEGMKFTQLSFSFEGTFPNVQSTAKLTYNKKAISLNTRLSHQGTTTGMLLLNLPVEGYETISVDFRHEGDLNDFKTEGSVRYAPGEEVKASFQHRIVDDDLISSIRFMSPFTDEISVSMSKSGNENNFKSAFVLSMGSDNNYKLENIYRARGSTLYASSVSTVTMSGEVFTQEMELKHNGTIENFATEFTLKAMEKVVQFESRFQVTPVLSGYVSLTTPFQHFERNIAKFSQNGFLSSGFLTTAEVEYNNGKKLEGKVDFMQHGWARMVAVVELKTPYKGMEMNRMSYEHTGDDDSFRCDLDTHVLSKQISGTLMASLKPASLSLTLRTPVEGFDLIEVKGNVNYIHSRMDGRMEASWTPGKSVLIDASGSFAKERIQGSVSLSTPFSVIKRATADGVFSFYLPKGMYQSVKATHNSKNLVDLELEYRSTGNKKESTLTVRAPRPMKYELSGDLNQEKVDAILSANWNTEQRDSFVRMEGGYDIGSNTEVYLKMSNKDNILSFTELLEPGHSKSMLTWGVGAGKKAGYDITYSRNEVNAKVIIPERSFVLSGSKMGRTTKGEFLWDADVDANKKVGFTSNIVPMNGALKADVTLIMPTIGKNVQVGSEVTVNRGRVLFDGKTELSYSSDERKKIVFSSRLEDVSFGTMKNYSFSLGLRHPYSTVGMKLTSFVGHSDKKCAAGVGVEYLTARRQTAVFRVNGEIDKLLKNLRFEMESPLKSIEISGAVNTDDKFRLSLLNVYDHRQPLKTVFTISPSQRSVDFVMNYDLANPQSEFHINARYVNSSALAAEMYHVISGISRTTDAIATLRLNSSHLIHSRVHWRPEMIDDLERLRERKVSEYTRRAARAAQEAQVAVYDEIVMKFHNLWNAIGEEIGQENVAKFEAAILPVLNKGLELGVGLSEHVYGTYVAPLRNATSLTFDKYARFVKAYKQYARNTKVDYQPLEKYDPNIYGMVSNHIDYLSDMIKVPGRRLPSDVTNAISYVANSTLPEHVFKQMSMVNRDWDISSHTESIVRSILKIVEEEILEELASLEKILQSTLKNPFTVYDPINREYQVEVYSPIPLVSLDVMPVVEVAKYLQKVSKYLEHKQQKVSQYIPAVSMPEEWLPPFSGKATIENGRRITTFDGFMYDLDATCTYMLARDFLDGNFSLILSNGDDRMLTILSNGAPIQININGDVLVNNKPVTLPYTQAGISVSAPSGDGVISINGNNHFSILYDTSVDHISIEVNGWYYGKTGGLLGTFDNEPSNDFMTPYNRVINNSGRFAKTWDVSAKSC